MLAVLYDGVIATEVATSGQRCKSTLAQFLLVCEDAICLFLCFAVIIEVRLHKQSVVVDILQGNKMLLEQVVNFTEDFVLKNFCYDILECGAVSQRLFLLGIVILTEKKRYIVTKDLLNARVRAVSGSKKKGTIHDKL